MPTIRNTVTINATPDEVWAVLSDMPATRQWLPGVVAARMDGDLRVCTMADGQEVHVTMATDVTPGDIASVEVRTASGYSVLRLAR